MNIFGDARFRFYPNLNHFCPHFTQITLISPKSNKICPNLINFAQIKFVRGCGCIESRRNLLICYGYETIYAPALWLEVRLPLRCQVTLIRKGVDLCWPLRFSIFAHFSLFLILGELKQVRLKVKTFFQHSCSFDFFVKYCKLFGIHSVPALRSHWGNGVDIKPGKFTCVLEQGD